MEAGFPREGGDDAQVLVFDPVRIFLAPQQGQQREKTKADPGHKLT
jgi:hypothetical protein